MRIVLVAVVLMAAGCSASVTGHGSAGSGTPPGTSVGRFPSSPVTTVPPSAQAPTTPPAPASSVLPKTPAPAYRSITVTGTTSGTRYAARIYASDTITDCAAHAYGTTMIAFLRKHRCAEAHRVLSTVVVDGRTAVVSAISTAFTSTGPDPYVIVSKFRRLENANGTGSINDLLREGHVIPGVASHIPATEAFLVTGQDDGVTIFDAWWQTGTTPDQAPTLLRVEQDLFLTPLT